MIVTAIVCALIAAAVEIFIGIPEPWRKLVWAGIVILLVLGVISFLLPGFPYFGSRV